MAALTAVFAGGLMLAGRALPDYSPLVPPALVQRMAGEYGDAAAERLQRWQTLLQQQQGNTDAQRLQQLNRFINRVSFIEDAEHWGVADYWATPAEFLATNGGDCEDFAIAKLFSLQAVNVPEARLRLMYVNALELQQPHMVLLYIEEGRTPLVLDNLTGEILPADQRPDLQPVYSFNGAGLWLNRQVAAGQAGEQAVEKYPGSRLWNDLVHRIAKEGFVLR